MRRIVKLDIVTETVILWVHNIGLDFITLHGHFRPESVQKPKRRGQPPVSHANGAEHELTTPLLPNPKHSATKSLRASLSMN